MIRLIASLIMNESDVQGAKLIVTLLMDEDLLHRDSGALLFEREDERHGTEGVVFPSLSAGLAWVDNVKSVEFSGCALAFRLRGGESLGEVE